MNAIKTDMHNADNLLYQSLEDMNEMKWSVLG